MTLIKFPDIYTHTNEEIREIQQKAKSKKFAFKF